MWVVREGKRLCTKCILDIGVYWIGFVVNLYCRNNAVIAATQYTATEICGWPMNASHRRSSSSSWSSLPSRCRQLTTVASSRSIHPDPVERPTTALHVFSTAMLSMPRIGPCRVGMFSGAVCLIVHSFCSASRDNNYRRSAGT